MGLVYESIFYQASECSCSAFSTVVTDCNITALVTKDTVHVPNGLMPLFDCISLLSKGIYFLFERFIVFPEKDIGPRLMMSASLPDAHLRVHTMCKH